MNEYRIATGLYKSQQAAGRRRIGDNEGVFNDFAAPALRKSSSERKRKTSTDQPTVGRVDAKTPTTTRGSSGSSASVSSRLRATKTVWNAWPAIHSGRDDDLGHWDSIRARNPTYSFPPVANDAGIGAFMNRYFSEKPRILQAFGMLPTAALRAEFWRYCVRYIHGGIYVDVPSSIDAPLEEWLKNDMAVIGFEDNRMDDGIQYECSVTWQRQRSRGTKRAEPLLTVEVVALSHIPVQWAMVYPRPGHAILNRTIELMTRLILPRQHDRNSCPFGNTYWTITVALQDHDCTRWQSITYTSKPA